MKRPVPRPPRARPRRIPWVVVERMPDTPEVPLPRRATPGSVGFDLHAAEAVRLEFGAVALVRTGLRMRPPRGTFLEVRPRSGLARRGVLMVNAPGTIDPDYAEEVRVPLTFLFQGHYEVGRGDRIAQVRLVPDAPTRVRLGRVPPVEGRSGGFGSTGR